MADQHLSVPGGIQHNRASGFAIEMAKWEMDSHEYGPPGRPRHQHGHQPFPAMFYRISRAATGGGVKVEEWVVAADEAAARNLYSRGFHNGLAEAASALERAEQAAAQGAAERNYQDRNLGVKAKAESAAAEEAHDGHLGAVPETPIVRPVRKT